MSLDKNGIASFFTFIALVEIAIIGGLALAQTDQNPFGLEEASKQTIRIGAIYNLEGSLAPGSAVF